MANSLSRCLNAFDAGAFVRKHGGRKESRSSASHEYLLHCPKCGGHNLRWNSKKGDSTGAWTCWNCQLSGDTLYLIQILERITLEGAIDYVRGAYVGGDASLDLKDLAVIQTPVAASAELRRLPPIQKPPSVDAREHPLVRAYLHNRHIDDAMIGAWGILAGTSGRTANHAIFPVVMDGAVVYWQARTIVDPPTGVSHEARKLWIAEHHWRKTLNPYNPNEGGTQATAGEILFNYDRARHSPHVVVVEGPVDAIKVGHHAVALFGKGTEVKIARLRRMMARRYTVYLDHGEEEREKAIHIAGALQDWADVYLATPPEGYDAGQLEPAQNAYVVATAVPFKKAAGLRSALRRP